MGRVRYHHHPVVRLPLITHRGRLARREAVVDETAGQRDDGGEHEAGGDAHGLLRGCFWSVSCVFEGRRGEMGLYWAM